VLLRLAPQQLLASGQLVSSASRLLGQRGWPHKECRNVGGDCKRLLKLFDGIRHTI
jgi:hypothetical protein